MSRRIPEPRDLKNRKKNRTLETRTGKERKKWDWTHFFNVPLNFSSFQEQFSELSEAINQNFGPEEYKGRFQGANIVHLSLLQMKLNPDRKRKLLELLPSIEYSIDAMFKDADNKLAFSQLDIISFGKNAGVLYVGIKDDSFLEMLKELNHTICLQLLKEGVIDEQDLKTSHINLQKSSKRYEPNKFHVTLMKSTF